MWDIQVMDATEAKTHFGTLLSNSQRSPVMIRKNKRDFSVMISIEDYEDMLLWAQAYAAEKEGFLGIKESKQILDTFR